MTISPQAELKPFVSLTIYQMFVLQEEGFANMEEMFS